MGTQLSAQPTRHRAAPPDRGFRSGGRAECIPRVQKRENVPICRHFSCRGSDSNPPNTRIMIPLSSGWQRPRLDRDQTTDAFTHSPTDCAWWRLRRPDGDGPSPSGALGGRTLGRTPQASEESRPFQPDWTLLSPTDARRSRGAELLIRRSQVRVLPGALRILLETGWRRRSSSLSLARTSRVYRGRPSLWTRARDRAAGTADRRDGRPVSRAGRRASARGSSGGTARGARREPPGAGHGLGVRTRRRLSAGSRAAAPPGSRSAAARRA